MAAVAGAVPDDIVEQAKKVGIAEKAAPSLYKAFTSFDTDNSGAVDRSELCKALELSGVRDAPHQVEEFFKSTKTEADGRANFSEFCQVSARGMCEAFVYIWQSHKLHCQEPEIRIHPSIADYRQI